MLKRIKNSNKKVLTIGLLLFLLVIYKVVNYFTGLGIPCLFYTITGWYCPGCGVTRMLFSMITLDFYQAFRYNPAVFVLLVMAIIYNIIKYLFKRDLKLPEYVYYILLVIFIIYGVLRNIPMFSYLIPTEL